MVPTPVISVIIPAYNAEMYLARCLDSILAQAQKDFEIIVVNDGSTDGTAQICDEYASTDPRIKVYHRSNGGASSARNVGLDMAQGEWIVFIDADDWIEGAFLPDSFVGDNDMYVQNWKFAGSAGQTEFLDAQVVPHNELNAFWQKHFHWDLFRSICSKFIKKEIVDKNRIRFDTRQRLGEDTLFFMEYIKHCNQIIVLSSGLYIYDRQEDGWDNKYNLSLETIRAYYKAFLERYECLPIELPYLADFEYTFFARFLSENDKKNNTWRFSKTVLRMKELRMSVCNPPLLYRARLYGLKLISLLTGIE